jgi:hypothetical protein
MKFDESKFPVETAFGPLHPIDVIAFLNMEVRVGGTRGDKEVVETAQFYLNDDDGDAATDYVVKVLAGELNLSEKRHQSRTGNVASGL